MQQSYDGICRFGTDWEWEDTFFKIYEKESGGK